ncbi:hypothetical protein CONPUDRAFT_148218 [Coniophora puteana RWD-64-598 SS2]|uniref:Uncharacterized protein n=1 Tax=Coniophora puteana (strain RWD-64-598) TaxID=741705 RepID=A0A5M3N483_CONPW|nr:uncharacterized protein CONPUDRAFT_148218 [Coniophora puteana RWD-64-598 SS2]EIW86106.1 hypothetical protein CONPUDRAFT_148218 [Coniophora puteana RWD-64-598 SS2]
MEYGKLTPIMPFYESFEGLSGNIFDIRLKSYLPEDYSVGKGDTFHVHGGIRTMEFKVIETLLPSCRSTNRSRVSAAISSISASSRTYLKVCPHPWGS